VKPSEDLSVPGQMTSPISTLEIGLFLIATGQRIIPSLETAEIETNQESSRDDS
jgi:hypothetical protein